MNDVREKAEQISLDSFKWTGRRSGFDPDSAKILIALFYVFAGPVLGAFFYIAAHMLTSAAPFNLKALVYLSLLSSLFLIPHAFGFVAALFAGLAVAFFASNRRNSFFAAWAAPAVLYALLFLTGDFPGAKLTFGRSPPLTLPFVAICASLTCWLLTLPLQRRT